MLVATPGRLNDLLERRLVSLDAVRVLVLDEADRMLDMGFRPQVDRIVREVPQNRQTLLFSATLEGPVADLARTYTVKASRFTTGAQTENVRGDIGHEFVAVTPRTSSSGSPSSSTASAGLRWSSSAPSTAPTSSHASSIARHRMRAAVLHGNMSQNARERSLAQFESGRVSTLIATDIAARGLDVDDITHVINFDPPRTSDDYVHRIGRTGRAGRTGIGVTLVLPEQRLDVSRLAGAVGHAHAFAASGIETPRAAPRAPRRRRR